MKSENSRCRRRSVRSTSVRQAVLFRQRRLQAMTNLVPGTLVLGFLLAPHDVRNVRVPLDGCGVLLDGERIEFFQPNDGHVFNAMLAAQFRQIVEHPAAAKYQPPNVLRRYGFVADQRIEAAFGISVNDDTEDRWRSRLLGVITISGLRVGRSACRHSM